MQITHIEVTPIELDLRQPYRMADGEDLTRVGAVFCRIETRQGETAWGCTAVDPAFMDATLEEVTRVCRDCADRALDLNPLMVLPEGQGVVAADVLMEFAPVADPKKI